MALSAGEYLSGGHVRDSQGRTVVISETAGAALSAGEFYSGGYLRDADGRMVICQDTVNAALGAGESYSGGDVRDSMGRVACAVDTVNSALSGSEQISGGQVRDSLGRRVIAIDTLGSALSVGEFFSGGNVLDKVGRTVVATETAAPSTYDIAVMADTPLAYLKLSATAGTTEPDLTGNGHNGAYSGTFTLNQAGPTTDGAPGVSFDGVSGLCQLADVLGTLGSGVTTSTWEMWIKTSSVAQIKSAFGTVNTGNELFELDINTNQASGAVGSTTLFVRDNLNIANYTVFATTIYNNVWHHVAYVISGGASAMVVTPYVDGAAQTPSSPAAMSMINFNFAFDLGCRNSRGTPGQFAAVTLARWACYPTALSAGRIAAHFAAR